MKSQGLEAWEKYKYLVGARSRVPNKRALQPFMIGGKGNWLKISGKEESRSCSYVVVFGWSQVSGRKPHQLEGEVIRSDVSGDERSFLLTGVGGGEKERGERCQVEQITDSVV